MKQHIPTSLTIILSFIILLSGCGYYFPHVYEGPSKNVYMQQWKNRTNQLGLDAKIYQSLSQWFQKSEAINLSKEKTESDLILAGEIVSIDLPSVSWGGDNRTSNVKVTLTVRYVLKDLKKDYILWEVPHEIWTQDYSIRGNNISAEDDALEQIIDDLSERIYLETLGKLRKENMQ